MIWDKGKCFCADNTMIHNTKICIRTVVYVTVMASISST